MSGSKTANPTEHSSGLRPILPASYNVFEALKSSERWESGEAVVVSFEQSGHAQERLLLMDLIALQADRFSNAHAPNVHEATLEASLSIYSNSANIGPYAPKLGRHIKARKASQPIGPHPLEMINRISQDYGNEGIVIVNLGTPGIEDAAMVIADSLGYIKDSKGPEQMPAVCVIDKGSENLISKRESGLDEFLGDSALRFVIRPTGHLSHQLPGAASLSTEAEQTETKDRRHTDAIPAEKPDTGTPQL
jgi:hypothetical protein